MTRQEKIEYLEGVKAGKIRLGLRPFISFVVHDGTTRTPDGKTISVDQAREIARDYETVVYYNLCRTKEDVKPKTQTL